MESYVNQGRPQPPLAKDTSRAQDTHSRITTGHRLGELALQWARISLVVAVWLSAILFGLYILAFYVGALSTGEMNNWNAMLPSVYEPDAPLATAGIGLHFIAGAIILILGCIQLLSPIRDHLPTLHRWIGRIYVIATMLAGIGGLTFIALKGTIGGTVMNIGFSLYGILVIGAATQTLRYARGRQLEAHRAMAIRLFALAIGSWLYRMDYGFWKVLTDNLGHTQDFQGPFDRIMVFFFYIPNLIVAEVLIGMRQAAPTSKLKLFTFCALVAGTIIVAVGTYQFTRVYWGPAIVQWILR